MARATSRACTRWEKGRKIGPRSKNSARGIRWNRSILRFPPDRVPAETGPLCRPATLCHRDFGQFADYPRSRILIARYRDRRFTDTTACRTCKQGEGHLHVRGGMPYTLKHARDTRPLGRPPVMVARFCTWPEGAPLRISLELE